MASGMAIPLTAQPTFAAEPTSPVQQAAARQRPEVYLLRGFGDVFSAGLDQIGDTLLSRGVDAHVQGHMSWQSVARKIIQDREETGARPIVLVGHSLGANAVIMIAEELGKRGIQVDQLVTLAATSPDPLPANVRRAANYYFEQHGWGRKLVAGPGFKGSLVNKDYSGIAEVGHFNIDKQRSVQNEILGLVYDAVR